MLVSLHLRLLLCLSLLRLATGAYWQVPWRINPDQDTSDVLALMDQLEALSSPAPGAKDSEQEPGANRPEACAKCQSVLAPLKSLARLGDDRFVRTLVNVCKLRKLADPDVCEGDIAAQGPLLAHDLRSITLGGRTAKRLCNALFGLCDPVPVTRHNVTFPKSVPDFEPAVASIGDAESRRRLPFQVVHISDVHIDHEYTVGADANCTKYICCQDFDGNGDREQEVSEPAGPFGNARCDTPVRLAESMLDAIRVHAPGAAFTVSTGDVVDHANWLESQPIVTSDLHAFHTMLKENLAHAFYGSLGNHDSYPTNAFARASSVAAGSTQWVFDLLSEDWEDWVGDNGAFSLRHNSGSYAVVHPGTQLRLIAVNTQYWYKYNLWLYDSDEFIPDPNGVLAFLVHELQAAEDAGQRAWIFGHIPPGSSDTFHDQSNYYNQIVTRYRRTISAQFFGHTHFDQFQVAYADYGRPSAEGAMNFGLIAPSLTPTNGNPAFTVYDIDPDTYEIMDAKVYIANMSAPEYQTEPEWSLLYSARTAYAPLTHTPPSAPLDAAFWHNLTEVFERNDTTFGEYVSRMARNAWEWNCGESCKNHTICGIRAMRSEDNCERPGGVLIREEMEHVCEGSALPGIMHKLYWKS